MRTITVLLPCFGLQVATRRQPDLRERALALAGSARTSPSGSSRILECSRRATTAGVRPGQTVAQARVACPEIVLVHAADEEMARARRDVVDALLLVGPKVEWGGGGVFHLDATGLSRYHRSEHAILVRCWQAVEELGLTARAGCAGTRLASLLAARARVTAVVPEGGEASFLAPQPISLLPLPSDARERLSLMGIRTLGAFARLSADGLADRFGTDVVRWHRVVRGEEPEPLVPLEDSRGPSITRELDEPVTSAEAATFLLKSCCEDMADTLGRRGLSAARIELVFVLDAPGERCATRRDARGVAPVRPVASARTLFDLCRLELEARPVAAPIRALALSIVETAPLEGTPGELFGRSLDPQAVAHAVDRVQVLLGEGSALTPAPRPAHRREDRRAWAPFDPRAAFAEGATPAAVGEAAPERLLARPLSAVVELAEGDRPGTLLVPSADRLEEACGMPARTDVVAQEGPVRVAGEWWPGATEVDRDEYLLLGADGGIYRACRDRRTNAWFVMGFID